ncbi:MULTISPECIES: toxin-activating lysine-acyltransferase [unclassified Maridesulfovibrio]|uniref:toxin-activating lysine-acyltransferase n=1 Tax=unclassified Maridesulfovibrio TaxID=2794999 RepID=UPI002A18BBC2|nr:toxin-activating lysine-acyltransferase [Maridesulfovibrio sp.]
MMTNSEDNLDFEAADRSFIKERGGESFNNYFGIPDGSAVFESVVKLLLNSPSHDHLFLSDMKWLVLPPLQLRQCKLYRQQGVAVAFASWAMLSPEAEKDFIRNKRLRPRDWDSGNRCWLVDVVTPYGNSEQVIKNLTRTALKEIPVQTLQFHKDGFRVVQLEEMLATTNQ